MSFRYSKNVSLVGIVLAGSILLTLCGMYLANLMRAANPALEVLGALGLGALVIAFIGALQWCCDKVDTWFDGLPNQPLTGRQARSTPRIEFASASTRRRLAS